MLPPCKMRPAVRDRHPTILHSPTHLVMAGNQDCAFACSNSAMNKNTGHGKWVIWLTSAFLNQVQVSQWKTWKKYVLEKISFQTYYYINCRMRAGWGGGGKYCNAHYFLPSWKPAKKYGSAAKIWFHQGSFSTQYYLHNIITILNHGWVPC